jgi:mutator protein MutT
MNEINNNMTKKRFTTIAAVLIILIKDNKIFLLKRDNTGYDDGKYAFPGGHLEGNETLRQAAIREAYEEIGITIKEEDLHFINLTHLVTNSERIHIAFLAKKWTGKPINNEQHKASDAQWFDIDDLPNTLNEISKDLIKAYKNNLIYTELGWR